MNFQKELVREIEAYLTIAIRKATGKTMEAFIIEIVERLAKQYKKDPEITEECCEPSRESKLRFSLEEIKFLRKVAYQKLSGGLIGGLIIDIDDKTSHTLWHLFQDCGFVTSNNFDHCNKLHNDRWIVKLTTKGMTYLHNLNGDCDYPCDCV